MSSCLMTLSACLSSPSESLSYKDLPGHHQGNTPDSTALFGEVNNLKSELSLQISHYNRVRVQRKEPKLAETKCIICDIYDLFQCHPLDV